MLSQIRQISDGNYNTVFVKNKEQKFNLDKEIHDLECWKQSRSHVYRKEERELLGHLDKLRQQQEYLHHLDEERSGHVRGSQTSSQRRHSLPGSIPLTQNASVFSPHGRDSIQEMDPHTTPELQYHSRTSVHTPSATLPPVISGTDNRVLHRAEAHTNICLICQLPRWSHGHPPGGAVCCCEEQEGRAKSLTKSLRRHTIPGQEEQSSGHIAPPIQVGQRRHSLMMARLNEGQFEHKPRPPERGHAGKSQQHDHVNTQQDHVHIHRHLHNHVHTHHDHAHHLHHHGHLHHGDHVNNHVNNHMRNTHGPHESHASHGPHDLHHGHYSSNNADSHHGNARQGGQVHHGGHACGHTNSGHRGSAHANNDHRHHHHGNHDETHTPSNSPRRYSRQSFSHYDPHLSNHETIYPHPTGHQYHVRRHSTTGSLGASAQDSDTRTRDHELHWDRHQVCKLKGMITDPHYKEQLEVESGRTYPWSGLYPSNKTRVEDIEELKNCRYLRFSKLNLMNMKENPEEEVEVFEKASPSP